MFHRTIALAFRSSTILTIATIAFRCSPPASAITVISTGDSITGQYREFMPSALASFGNNYVYPNPVFGAGGSDTARGGMASWNYTGLNPFPNDVARDYSQNVVNAQPDVILFLLSINDVTSSTDAQYHFEYGYKPVMDACFAKFQNTGARLVISGILPVHYYFESLNDQIQNMYNAWLKTEADLYGAVYLDAWSSMRQTPNYSDLLLNWDGVHLSYPYGSQWFARQMAQAAAMSVQNDMTLPYDTISTHDIDVGGAVNVLGAVTVRSIAANALRIGATGTQAVPEPSSAWLLAAASAGAMFSFIFAAKSRF
ncbi:MAG: SGNH/GDSL hydrolase family protein [Pirellulales bacterium]|nr:SGNH/GDSL hydrolase family protein [Pirellulales bacterium]